MMSVPFQIVLGVGYTICKDWWGRTPPRGLKKQCIVRATDFCLQPLLPNCVRKNKSIQIPSNSRLQHSCRQPKLCSKHHHYAFILHSSCEVWPKIWRFLFLLFLLFFSFDLSSMKLKIPLQSRMSGMTDYSCLDHLSRCNLLKVFPIGVSHHPTSRMVCHSNLFKHSIVFLHNKHRASPIYYRFDALIILHTLHPMLLDYYPVLIFCKIHVPLWSQW